MADLPLPPARDLTWDWGTALARVEGDGELLRELAELFLAAVGHLREDIRSAVAARDADQLAFRAHRLKSSLANFFAGEASAAATTLEQMGRARVWDGAATALQVLESALDRLLPAEHVGQHPTRCR